MARECVFCGEPVNSNEHAFPLWMGGLAPGEGPMLHGRERAGSAWWSSTFDVKVRQVCRECNQTWMNNLETRTRGLLEPLVLGKRTRPLAALEQKALSAWGFKTGIMLALAHPKEERFVPADHYRCFMKEEKPPHGVHIWIAGVVPDLGNGQYTAGWSKPERLQFHKKSGETFDSYGYRLSFSVVCLVFQIVFDPLGGKLRRPRELRDIWTRIRPISKGEWPPSRWIAAGRLDEITKGRLIFAAR